MNIIACVDENWGIGYENKLLFHINEDMSLFKKTTMDSGVVIMGRKTFDSIGSRPLPNRLNIILTSNPSNISFNARSNTEVKIFSDINGVLSFLKQENLMEKAYVIGGSSIYEQFIPYCNHALITKVDCVKDLVDSYFPNLDKMDDWKLTTTIYIGNNDYDFSFNHYYKKTK